MNRPVIFRGAAVALCGLGLLLAMRAARLTPPRAEQIRSKIADLEQLRLLQEEQSHRDSAVAFFDRLPAQAPLPVRELIGRVFTGVQPAIHVKETRKAASDWTVRSIELTFDQIALSDLSRLLLAARGDGDRPPWRLVDCQITASEQGPGYGRVTLSLEALEKSAPAPTAF